MKLLTLLMVLLQGCSAIQKKFKLQKNAGGVEFIKVGDRSVEILKSCKFITQEEIRTEEIKRGVSFSNFLRSEAAELNGNLVVVRGTELPNKTVRRVSIALMFSVLLLPMGVALLVENKDIELTIVDIYKCPLIKKL